MYFYNIITVTNNIMPCWHTFLSACAMSWMQSVCESLERQHDAVNSLVNTAQILLEETDVCAFIRRIKPLLDKLVHTGQRMSITVGRHRMLSRVSLIGKKTNLIICKNQVKKLFVLIHIFVNVVQLFI